MNIFAGSLPYSLEESVLKDLFEEYGEVSSVRIITDKFTGRSKGFGFVDMPNDDQAKAAIEALNGKEINGRAIVVNVSEERKDGERRGGGGFRGGNNRSGGGGFNRGGSGGGFNRGGSGGGDRRGGSGGGDRRGGGGRRSDY